MLLLISLVVVALVFDFMNGRNDAANSVATIGRGDAGFGGRLTRFSSFAPVASVLFGRRKGDAGQILAVG